MVGGDGIRGEDREVTGPEAVGVEAHGAVGGRDEDSQARDRGSPEGGEEAGIKELLRTMERDKPGWPAPGTVDKRIIVRACLIAAFPALTAADPSA